MATGDELRREWEAFAPAWIERSERDGDVARVGLLDDWMLDIVGDVSGLRVIDLGCGEGRFSRMLAARGASTLGVDLQPSFVSYATERAGVDEAYAVGDIQRLDDVPAAAFDLAVAYLSFVDVPDQTAAAQEAARVLCPGGRLVLCNLSPMATAGLDGNAWHRDEAGHKLHYVLDTYSVEGERPVRFGDDHTLTNFHRMLSTTLDDLFGAGFHLRRLAEPVPNDEQLARAPSNEDLFRVPIFTIYDLVKAEA